MPTSDVRQVPAIIAELQRLRASTILDAGCGYGKYGPLIREFVDDWRGDLVIDALDGFPSYLESSGLAIAYNEVIVADLAEWDPDGRTYDVVLLVDVLEHFERIDGAAVLRLLASCCRYLIVATPREPAEQDAPYGNPLETHRSQWSEDDLVGLFPVERFVPVAGDDQIILTLRGAWHGYLERGTWRSV